jgi:PGM1 C-terminal domain
VNGPGKVRRVAAVLRRMNVSHQTSAVLGNLVRRADGVTGVESDRDVARASLVSRSASFARLQQRMPAIDAAIVAGRERRSVLVVPYGKIEGRCEAPAETQAYEQRPLGALLELRDPNLWMTYVTSSTIAPTIIDYYFSLLPRALRRSARSRLTLIALDDRTSRPLSEKLLERPWVLDRIRRAIRHPRLCHLVPYTATELERDLALALEVPMYGADPRHAHLGTKSGCRELFALAGIPHPLGAEHIRSVAGAIDAIIRLRAIKPQLTELVIKLNHGVAGDGNAIVDLAALPDSGTPDEAPRIEQRLATLAPEASTVTVAAYLAMLTTHGGIVEERIAGPKLRSPSVQLQITSTGQVKLLSTHDQILGGPSGQSYLGCRFPAEASYAPAIGALARRVGQRLADTGVIGRLAIDFVVARRHDNRWEPFAIELNLREGGTTHPYQTLAHLAGGAYNADDATFTTPSGQAKFYVATDHFKAPQLRALGCEGVLALARHGDLRFDRMRGTGTVFHMLSSLDELGRTGFTAIGDSPESADALYDRVQTTLIRQATARELRSAATSQGSGAPESATTAPIAAAPSNVSTTPRRSASSTIAAAARTANCQASLSAAASVIAAPRIAPIAAGPAPSRKARALRLSRIRSKRPPPSRMNENEGANAMAAASRPPARP